MKQKQKNNIKANIKGLIGQEFGNTLYNLLDPCCASANGSVVNVTFNQLQTLVDSNSLAPNAWYTITDWRSVSIIPGKSVTNVEKRGNDIPAHNLHIQASTSNTFFPQVIDTEFPDDMVLYDFTGEAGGDSYPTDGTGMGWVYYRGWYNSSSSGRPPVLNEIYGFDIRNAVVALHTCDASVYGLAADERCLLRESLGGGLFDSSFNNITLTSLDNTDYEEGVNDDGVQYKFMVKDTKTYDDNFNGVTWKPSMAWNDGITEAIPYFYVDPKATVIGLNFTGTVQGQYFLGAYTSTYSINFSGFCNVTMAMSQAFIDAVIADNGASWQFSLQKSSMMEADFCNFRGFLVNSLFRNSNDNEAGVFTGRFCNKGNVTVPWTTGTLNKCPFIIGFQDSKVFINADHADWQHAFGGYMFVRTRRFTMTEGTPYTDGYVTFVDAGNVSRLSNVVVNFGGFNTSASIGDYVHNGYLQNCTWTIDFAAGAIADFNLSSDEDPQVRGIINLTNGTVGGFDNIGTGRQDKILITNNTGVNATITDGGDVSGAVRFAAGSVGSPLVLADGESIILTRVNDQWWVR